MIARLAVRSLATRPVRTLILAVGFGLGIAVMAILLGVGEVILDEARSPALAGGGDVVVSGALGDVDSARFVTADVLRAGELGRQVAAVSPSRRATLYLRTPARVWSVVAHGGVPSLERAIGDPETADEQAWVDEPADRAWVQPAAGDVLRAMDRFHPIPNVPEFAHSWAEWLYFNGRTPDGRTRFYLTFMVGPEVAPGRRTGGVRLQLQRDEVTTNYSAAGEVDERAVLERAPDLDIAGNHVRLEGSTYAITLDLRREPSGARLTGSLTLEPQAGRSLPPVVMHGARGWISGYTVPVLSGALSGTLDGQPVQMAGYHDHNWGFWQGVRWQWGQVAHGDLSFVYGRVFPPATVADARRMPGFLGVLGPDGVLGVSTRVSIEEDDAGREPEAVPRQVRVAASGNGVNVRLALTVDQAIRTQLGLTRSAAGAPMDFLQLSGVYDVTGQVGGRAVAFSSRGAAETFR